MYEKKQIILITFILYNLRNRMTLIDDPKYCKLVFY